MQGAVKMQEAVRKEVRALVAVIGKRYEAIRAPRPAKLAERHPRRGQAA